MNAPTLGVDYASIDGNRAPNLDRARGAGIRFAIVRGAWGTSIDPHLARDWPALGAAGMVRGAYLFLQHPRRGQPAPAAPDVQARALLAAIRALGPRAPLDLPPALDVELPGAGRSETGLTARQVLDRVLLAWRTLRDGCGVSPLVYTSSRVWHEDLADLDAPDLYDSPLWIKTPYYWAIRKPWDPTRSTPIGALPAPWKGVYGNRVWLHQIQGDATGCPGFSATVDGNHFLAMRAGETGDRVRWVQHQLGVAMTGAYDTRTVEAVKSLQRNHRLQVDGVVGPQTFAALCWSGAPVASLPT